MEIYHDAWYTQFDQCFDPNKYLYHFTKIDSATKILHNKTLKFSKVSRANDTIESKPRISFAEKDQRFVQEAIHVFRAINNQHLQILCFSMDNPQNESSYMRTLSAREKLTNFTGRGFALPRMWAQYANNNTGTCFIFNKEKLTEIICHALGSSLLMHRPVEYLDYFQQHPVDYQPIIRLIKQRTATSNDVQRSLSDMRFLLENPDFVEYNYFSKLKDWENEKEYRFVAYGPEDYYIDDILPALSGVVVGENIEPENERIIRLFCKGICEVMKVSFSYAGCQLTTIKE